MDIYQEKIFLEEKAAAGVDNIFGGYKGIG